MINSEIELLQAEIKCSKVKIETIDMVLKDGTIEQKIDFILSEIRDREAEKELKSRNKLSLETMMNAAYSELLIGTPHGKFTNADRIRNMNNEELAEFISTIDIDECSGVTRIADEQEMRSVEEITEWLEKEVVE